MNIEQAYTEYICNTPEKCHSLLDVGCASVLSQNERENDLRNSQPQITENISCCPHANSGAKPHKKNKFLLSFEATDNKNGKSCEEIEAERAKCENFWNLVDKHPLLASAFKDGTFLHKSQPKILEEYCVIEKKSNEHNGFEFMAEKIQKMKENRFKEAELMRKRQEARVALQQKSGQPVRKPKPPLAANTLAKILLSDPGQCSPSNEFYEMKQFDSQKFSPPPPKAPSEIIQAAETEKEKPVEVDSQLPEDDKKSSGDDNAIKEIKAASSSDGLKQVLRNQDFEAPSTLIHVMHVGEIEHTSEADTANNNEEETKTIKIIQPPPPKRSDNNDQAINFVSVPSHTLTISKHGF